MSETRQQILPFYLVCDESFSMHPDGIEAINQALPDLHAVISSNPSVADKTRFSMIGFSDDAEVLLDLVDLSDVESMPGVMAKNGTSFSSAFSLLRTQIAADVKMLKADGHRVYRPVVFFMSDGNPTDDNSVWQPALDGLLASETRPNIVAFGVTTQVDAQVIARVGTFKAFVADGTLSPAHALKEFATALTKSIIASGTSVDTDGNLTLQVPEEIEGFTALKLDEL